MVSRLTRSGARDACSDALACSRFPGLRLPACRLADGRAVQGGGRSEEEFLARYDRIITADVISAVDNQSYAALFANADGVMIGDGEVWFSGIRSDEACEEQRIRIIAIDS